MPSTRADQVAVKCRLDAAPAIVAPVPQAYPPAELAEIVPAGLARVAVDEGLAAGSNR